MTTTSDSQVRPRRTGGLTANFVPEGGVIPQSQLQFDAITATPGKLAILTVCSSELLEDEASDLGAFLASEVAYAFAGAEDDCAFNGPADQAHSGIQGLSTKLTTANSLSAIVCGSGHNAFSNITGADVTGVISGVLASALPGSAWYTGAVGYALTFCRLASVAGGLVVTPRSDGSGAIDANYLGFPVYFSSKLPNVTTSLAGLPMLYFGNLKMSSCIVQRGPIVIGMSRQRLLDTDQIMIRATQRLDIINHDAGSATSVGPVAALIGTT